METNVCDAEEVSLTLMSRTSFKPVGIVWNPDFVPNPEDHEEIEDTDGNDGQDDKESEIEVSPVCRKQEKKTVIPPPKPEPMVTRGRSHQHGKSTLEGVIITKNPKIHLVGLVERSPTPPPVSGSPCASKKAKGKVKQKIPTPKTSPAKVRTNDFTCL